MSQNLEDVLQKLGWSDGFQIPIANTENKALEAELAKLTLRKQRGKTTLEVQTSRLEALNDHLKYVSQESEQTQKLINAHRQQLETMENNLHTTKADNKNIKRAIRTSTHSLKEADKLQEDRKNDLQKLIVKADRLKAEMDWDTEALKAWEEALKKRDEDIDLLKKFFKDDDRRFNQLEARRQHLRAELSNMRDKVAKIAMNTYNCEQMIERSGKVIKELSVERDYLINQWKDTVKMLQQRDNDIMKTQEQLCHMHEVLQKQEEKLDEENKFLANEQKNNKELETQVQECSNNNARLRNELGEVYQQIIKRNVELHSLKRLMTSTSLDLKNERLKIRTLEEQFSEKEAFCRQFGEEMHQLKIKLEEVRHSAMSSEDRIKSIENMIEREEKLYNVTLVDIEKINGELFRTEQLLKEQKNVGRNLEVNINLGACSSAQLRKHIAAERKELDRIKEIVYEMEYRIDECERKLLEIAEVKNQEVPEEIQQKLQELEESIIEHKEVQQSLQSQVDRLRKEMRRLSGVIAADKDVLDALQNKCENFLLEYEICQKQIAAARKSVQETQVEENMMRLRLGHIEKDKKKEEKQIFNLEIFRLNLDQAMKERQLEINTQKQILQAKRRNLEEDRGRLRGDVAIRKIKIEQYQSKYHLAITGLGKDEDGNPITVTYLKIKNAQEKFFLKQEGDNLDKKIKNTEKEIVALENTLKIVNLTNASFKNSLAPVKDNDPEVEEMNSLEEELKHTFSDMKKYRTELAVQESHLEVLTKQIQEAESNLNANLEVVQKIEDEILSAKKQEQDKEEKLKRVECELKKLYKLIKKMDKKELYRYNRDFEIRHLQDTNKKVLHQLRDLSISYPEMAPVIGSYLIENNLELPDRKLTPSTHSTLSTPPSCPTSQQNTQRTDTTVNSGNSQVPITTVNLAFAK